MHTAPRPFRRLLLALSLMLSTLPAFAQTAPATAKTQSSRSEFDRLVSAIRADGGMPGIVALGFRDGQFWASAQGIRRLGSVDKVRIDDRFHIGSNIKSMTATVIAELVERRRLRWDSTLGAMFPDVPMHPAYRHVTLEQLLQHRGGIVPLPGLAEIAEVPVFRGGASAQRQAFARWALALPPATAPGTFEYSNGGYAIAGAIIERASGMPYETAMQRYLFKPLGMNAKFGWPAAVDPDQPWGHADVEGDGVQVVTTPNDPRFLFPLWLRPAGDLSVNIADYTKYVMLHAEAVCGRPRLLSAASFRRLHVVPVSADGEAYSMGWVEFTAANGVQYAFHSGSGGNFYATIAYNNRCERGIAIFSNSGTEPAAIATETAVLEWMK